MRSSRESGYSLVMLMMLLTVLSIAIAASLPAWSGVIRREKEEELIFRGLQYAEAIRVFQNRFQRPPIRLEELVEVEPRSIRKLWKDPMTESGKWALIPLQGPGSLQAQQIDPNLPQQEKPDPDAEEPEGREGPDEDEGGFGPKPKEEVQIGPFKGVHSKSNKTSFLVFNGRDRYDEWHFTVELLLDPTAQGLGGGGPAGPGGDPTASKGAQLQMSARWIGRPIPESLLPRQGTGLPDDGFDDSNGRKDDGPGTRQRGTGKP